MAAKNKIQVLIGGKIYTISGFESEDYLQKVAAYLNNKISEVRSAEGYPRMSSDMKSLLLDLNVADDYFKLKKQADQLGEQMSVKDRELYDLKHEFIQTQMKLESTSKTLETLQQNAAQDQKRIIQLETLLNQSKNRK